MSNLSVTEAVAGRFKPFADEILAEFEPQVDSLYITGSAVTADYDPAASDINSVLVLKKMDLKILPILAPLGKKYGRRKISAPLIMTPDYIRQSLDVFPIEFLNIQWLHHTVFGTDRFQALEVRPEDLRNQCEREIKARLIGLRQGYISAAGNRQIVAENLTRAITGYLPLFRALLALLGRVPPRDNDGVVAMLEQVTGIDTGIFKTILNAKRQKTKLTGDMLDARFEAYYAATEKLSETIDGLQV